MAATTSPVMLVADQLAWFAGLPRGIDSGREGHHVCEFWHQFRVTNYSDHPQLRGGSFSVPHYGPSAWGSAYGPLSLDQMLSFCSLLQDAIATNQKVTVATEPDDAQERATVAVMLGGYLILSMGWSMQDVHAHFAIEAGMGFPRCWPDGRNDTGRAVTVADCWSAITLAKRMDWIPADRSWADWSKLINHTAMRCDCSWLVPGAVAVGADPITVICDPKPFTLQSLAPMELKDPCCSSLDSSAVRGTGSLPTTSAGTGFSPFQSALTSDADSCHTLCKDYNCEDQQIIYEHSENHEFDYPDFVGWCKASKVALIVQANLPDEAGIREMGGSYDPSQITAHGLEHFSSTFQDTNGAVPSPACVRSAINSCTDRDALGAVFFHCKGGFGRSVSLACSYIIFRYDVPGRALLAWARMCRPGAIITPQQERFLCSKGGRRDMEKYMHAGSGANTGCCQIA